jgi:serine/threonine protein kinase/tetratricopeptide (TPR) repeat protein
MPEQRDIIEKYEFLEKLGEGSFGEVWLAKDPKIGEKVALKYLHLDKTSEDYLELFKREFEILCEIRHTHLARVFDFGFSPKMDQYFFTSEFCPGKEFIESAEGKPYEYVEEMLVQILTALDYVHSQGIIHFDIKSENILVSEKDDRPHVKILDFGVAAKLKALPQGVAGTPSYMAPEIMTKGATIDHRADLYSLGILLLRTLTGKLPFGTEDTDEVLQWHLKGELPKEIWDGVEIPRYMREIIEKLLAKKPADRFSNARVVLHFLNISTGRKYLKAEQNLEGKIPREGPLVEREAILERLNQHFNTALFSDEKEVPPSVCLITGAQGMGKTRILDEMRHTIELKEVPFFEVVCDWQVPAWPKLEKWLDLAGKVTTDMSEDWQTRVRVDAIAERAREKPFCLLIDEFHKADRITKAVIPALAERLASDRVAGRPAPVFVLAATEQSVEKGIALPRLSAGGIAKYIDLVLGQTERSESVAQLLHQYSGGLPLLMVEGLRFLAPHLYRDEPLENLLPPPQIGLLYSEKIKSLKEDENDLLSTLALIFRPTTDQELAKIFDTTEATIAALADACIRNELVGGGSAGEGEPAIYQVSSQALSLDIIRSIEPDRSTILHKRIAKGLAQVPATPLNEIAYHSAKGGETEKAINLYREAASDYKEHHQVATATDCLVKAIDVCPPGLPAWKELLQDAAQLLIVSGSYTEAEKYLGKIDGETTAIAEELRGLVSIKKRELGVARKHYERGLELLPEDEILQTILMKNSLANVAVQQGKLDEAAELFRQTIESESKLTPEDRQSVSNNSLGLVLAFQGDIDGAVEFYEERIKQTNPERVADLVSLENGLGYVLFAGSRYEESIPHLRKAMDLSENSGAMNALFSSMGNLIGALLKEARYAESLPLLEKMRNYQERLGTTRDLIFNLLREGSVYLTVGMEEAAQQCFKKGRNLSLDTHDMAMAAWFTMMEGYREREYGKPEKAKKIFLAASLEAEELQDNTLVAWIHYAVAELELDEGNRSRCLEHLGLIKEHPKDEDYEARMQLIQARLARPSNENEVNELFRPLERRCVKDKLQELLWEIYYHWAKAMMEVGSNSQAMPLLLKGIRTLEDISSALPEEYRDRYLKQHARRNLFDVFKELTAPTKTEKAPKKAKVHEAKKTKEGTVSED